MSYKAWKAAIQSVQRTSPISMKMIWSVLITVAVMMPRENITSQEHPFVQKRTVNHVNAQ